MFTVRREMERRKSKKGKTRGKKSSRHFKKRAELYVLPLLMRRQVARPKKENIIMKELKRKKKKKKKKLGEKTYPNVNL